jgi:glutathione S-transferase
MQIFRLFLDATWMSPYSLSVFAALKEKGIPFEVHEVKYERGVLVDPELAGKTYTDLIPKLQHGEVFLAESLAILEYLEELFPAPGYRSLFPRGAVERARARMLLSWYRCAFHRLREERPTESILYPGRQATKALSGEAREEVEEWVRVLRQIRSPGAEFLFGEWSIADSETALMLHRLIASGDELDADLGRYAEALWRRPSMAEFVNAKRRLPEGYYR